jgi:hypothetical protein
VEREGGCGAWELERWRGSGCSYRRGARRCGRPRARGDVAARVSAGSAVGGRGGGVAVQSAGTRWRSCGGKLLREMRERGGIDPDYATVIKIGRIEDASSLAREMHEGRRAGRRGGESKATIIAWRARKEQLRGDKAVRTGVTRRGFDAQRKTDGEVTGPGGPSGIEPARSRVRAEVFYRWPARLDSAGVCACKATGHARAD